MLLINYRLWYEGAPKYLGESVTGAKMGYGICMAVCVWLVREIGWEYQWMHKQIGTTLLYMCKGFSHLNEEADNCDIIR